MGVKDQRVLLRFRVRPVLDSLPLWRPGPWLSVSCLLTAEPCLLEVAVRAGWGWCSGQATSQHPTESVSVRDLTRKDERQWEGKNPSV